MSTDYSKKKVDELQDLLKARSLPHTGKKAELVARLQTDDTEKASKPQAAPNKTATSAEDEIDWEDDATGGAPAASAPGAAALAAGGQAQPPNPTAVPNQAVATDPSTTNDLKTDPPAPTNAKDASAAETNTTSAAPETTFTSNLPTSTLDDELAKRKARAARFGTGGDDSSADAEALKALERAKKFGTGTVAGESKGVRGLDEALPERRPKRGRDGDGGGGGRQGKRSRVRGEKDGGAKDGGGSAWLSEKDRDAAEARKKRFGA